ncbi:capsid portal protein [Spheniscid alphaherpesvirus 1]|uniref:Capsid portal protein n=1 Tax=Spheniscid alphaherpesvirus 1 TaxID=2560777 RepID=A0A1R3T200_9ALPH|nr:capsid portal protein [Spheniscid alphaherpesvirus 1]
MSYDRKQRGNVCGIGLCRPATTKSLYNHARGGNVATSLDDWILIHPSPRTALFKQILLGELGYTEGQGVYNSVRSTEAAVRQIQASILTNTLDAARYEDLVRDWEKYASSRRVRAEDIADRYGPHSEAEAVRVAEQVFETWRQTLRTALLDFIRGVAACFASSEPDGAASFSKYIDWITCVGLVPVIRTRPGGRMYDRAGCRIASTSFCTRDGRDCLRDSVLRQKLIVAENILNRGINVVEELAECVNSVAIMDYDRAHLFYSFRRREVKVRDSISGHSGECLVIWHPLYNDGNILFDSPMQRMYREVMSCRALREHARICQLINTIPIKVLVGKRNGDDSGVAGVAKAVDKALGTNDDNGAGSAASRLVKLIINMKGMRHVGDITETVRSYLDETGGHLLDETSVDTTQPGFGRSAARGAGGQSSGQSEARRVQDAFRTSVVNNINGMLEGYVNNLFKTIEGLKDANGELLKKLRDKEVDLERAKSAAITAAQSRIDAGTIDPSVRSYNTGQCSVDDPSEVITGLVKDLDYEIIDVSGAMGDDTYVANSFQSRFIPQYGEDVDRLSRLWEQELMRCFKMNRVTNNQGQELSLSYSNSAIALLVAPYFFSVLRARHIGFLVATHETYRSEEELCMSIFKKTRLEAYLTDIATLFIADVRREVALLRCNSETGIGYSRGYGNYTCHGYGVGKEEWSDSSSDDESERSAMQSPKRERDSRRASGKGRGWGRVGVGYRRRVKLASSTSHYVRGERGPRETAEVRDRISKRHAVKRRRADVST